MMKKVKGVCKRGQLLKPVQRRQSQITNKMKLGLIHLQVMISLTMLSQLQDLTKLRLLQGLTILNQIQGLMKLSLLQDLTKLSQLQSLSQVCILRNCLL